MTTPKTQVSLIPAETFGIATCLRYLDEFGVSRQFLLDFAVVFTHQFDISGLMVAEDDALWISEADLLKLRESIPLTSRVGNTPVGITLHRKFYEALLRLNTDEAQEVKLASQEGPTFSMEDKKRLKEFLAHWRKRRPRRAQSPNQDKTKN